MDSDERIERTRRLYERAVFGGDAGALAIAERALDAVEADLALARGRVIHGRFLEQQNQDPEYRNGDADELAFFERAAHLYQALGDVRGQAESLFWIGTFHQVVRGDNDSAVPALDRSYELAAEVGDELTMSYALRHLGIAAHVAGDTHSARARLEESVRLRRRIGFLPGVAANLVGLAYIAAQEGRLDDARSLVEEAGQIAEATDAQGVLRSVDEARKHL